MDENTPLTSAEVASKGGEARAASLTPEQRKEIAQKAAAARWNAGIQKATHEGDLIINGISINCAVLEDGTRVISKRAMSIALGRGKSASGPNPASKNQPKPGDAKLPAFMRANNLKPFVDADLEAALINPIIYTPLINADRALGIGHGFKAEYLPRICEVWLKAKDAGVLRRPQLKTAEVANILMRGLAQVGIVALVDEATGYQYDRARHALEEILETFIAKELMKWTKMFPDDYYQEMFRLKKWRFNAISTKRPIYVGKLTLDIVYERIAPGVLEELKRLTPRDDKGRLRHKLFQRLTEDIGHPRLREHLTALIALMRASDDWQGFYKLLNRALPPQVQMPLFDTDWKWDESAEQES